MIRVFISPDYHGIAEHADRGGIRRVCEAQIEHLPKFGVEVVHNPSQAEVIINHAASLVEVPGVPSINVNHGMMWSRYPWGDGMEEVNRQLVESMRHAVAWTAPSNWVNNAIRRGGFFYPETVYHGVSASKFSPSKTNGGYVLWDKLRHDYVSDSGDMQKLAAKMQNRQFKTTIGRADHNVSVVGTIPYPQMQKLVSEAGVYLATARETFGIGTLEAMACGIPIAGFSWGGTSEIVINGETGYLAHPGNYKELAECVERCFAERERLSRNAIEDVRTRWGWEPRIEQYANIIKRVHAKWYDYLAPQVSVLITAYKLDQYLPDCLESVTQQTFNDFECLVIDDAQLKSTEMIVRDYAQRDKRIRYVPTPNNFGLSGARNYGVSISKGKYIRHLDADDFLALNALELETIALNTDRGTDIVYGHLEVVHEDGSQIKDARGNVQRGNWPAPEFNWYRQMAHLNQPPSCVMARRTVFERVGGYRERMKRNEDAEFWCRATSLGIRAKKFTQAVTYYHRERADSKGAQEWKTSGGEPDWTAWFPWKMGSSNLEQANEVIRSRGDAPEFPSLVPFGAQGKSPAGMRFWYIMDYAYPVVSIIVTVGPGHKHLLIDALDSIQAQTYPDWECVVVNDTGEKWPSDIMGAPFAKVINMDGNQGASAARNEGFRHIKGKYVVFLDADDYLMPWFLDKMIGYAEWNDGVIYSDFIMQGAKDDYKIYRYAENFDPRALKSGCAMPGTSILIPRHIMDAVVERDGGWDTQIPGMEDWALQLSICSAGFCFFHITEPLFVYRTYSSTKREKDFARREEVREYINKKYDDEAWKKIVS